MNTPLTTLRTFTFAALLAFGGPALAQGPHGAGHDHGAHDTSGAHTGMPMMGGAMGMGMAMHAHVTDEAGFLTHMIPHHQEAVDSAQVLLEVTERPELRALAEAIIASQTAEIEAMEGWLARWHPEASREVAYAPMMRDLGSDAPAAAVERAFLEDMIMHHMMAVRDSQMLLTQGLAEHDEVAALARSIVTEQLTEIDQMRGWLVDWFGVTMGMGMMHGPEGVDTSVTPGGMMHGGMMHGGMGHGMGMMGHGSMPMHGVDGVGMHGGHARGTATALVDAAEAMRLAQAFLDGRGAGTVTVVEEPVVTFEVRFEDADGGGVLIVDARTGTVRVASER